eukprot:CAMPEP_0204368396 /NCGR_PEP_ID=MMETSP0469-20131031/44150_1 /ASSEMBLY_ACC=CAM_ASM_000384 /TAXON_ID=2969 /ORGANISM="Oxyrrhis marina" /LENGTH=45 /DNA_ID= /DNA_START= /DNA_END= /DNA_ORIENTATION=
MTPTINIVTTWWAAGMRPARGSLGAARRPPPTGAPAWRAAWLDPL